MWLVIARRVRSLPADLEDDHGLAAVGGAVERGHEALGLARSLSVNVAMIRVCGVVDEVLEKVRGGRATASLPDEITWLQPKRRQSARSPMQIEPLCEIRPTLPARRGGIARRVLEVDGAAVVRVDDAHAVGPAERDPGLAADRRRARPAPAPVLAPLGEAAVEDDGGARAPRRRPASACARARACG